MKQLATAEPEKAERLGVDDADLECGSPGQSPRLNSEDRSRFDWTGQAQANAAGGDVVDDAAPALGPRGTRRPHQAPLQDRVARCDATFTTRHRRRSH